MQELHSALLPGIALAAADTVEGLSAELMAVVEVSAAGAAAGKPRPDPVADRTTVMQHHIALAHLSSPEEFVLEPLQVAVAVLAAASARCNKILRHFHQALKPEMAVGSGCFAVRDVVGFVDAAPVAIQLVKLKRMLCFAVSAADIHFRLRTRGSRWGSDTGILGLSWKSLITVLKIACRID